MQWGPSRRDPSVFCFQYWLYYNNRLDAEEYLEKVVKIHWPDHRFEVIDETLVKLKAWREK